MIDIELVKAHLRLDDDEFTDNKVYVEFLVSAVVATFEADTNRVLVAAEQDLPEPVGNVLVINHRIIQGALLLIGKWYACREDVVVGVSVAQLPEASKSLWAPYRWANI